MALTIVGNIENIDDVCKRLIDHLGNTRILRQNKVSALENVAIRRKNCANS